jgi:hypothetical protein
MDVVISNERWNQLWDHARKHNMTLKELLEESSARFKHNNGITWTIHFDHDIDATAFLLRWA